MCGILFTENRNREEKNIEHRGPDDKLKIDIFNSTFAFYRLSINDLSDNGMQPFVSENVAVICNGEIYNHKELSKGFNIKSSSDCEVLMHLLESTNDFKSICNMLDGVYAIVAKFKNGEIFAARDTVGVRPLFYGYDKHNGICFSSEIKGLLEICKSIYEVPPGHYYFNKRFVRFSSPMAMCQFPNQYNSITLNLILHAAVIKRLMSDAPIGFFLSGGLDSSLIAGIAAQHYNKPIHTFSIGIGESPDIIAARKVSSHIQSIHHEIIFTVEEGLEALQSVIWHLESYDCTTIRASVPMFLLSKYVRENTDIKVILSGEGADELFGGYLYLHNAPEPSIFHNECLRLLEHVHCHDVLRADRSTAAHGLEIRVPFFDKTLMSYVKGIPTEFRIPSYGNIEKFILRESFEKDNIIPNEILWRQKNGMSDAVGYSWVNFMRTHACDIISDEEYNTIVDSCSRNIPLSKEEALYRNIYHFMFDDVDLVPHVWRPKWSKLTDPSAALLDIHTENIGPPNSSPTTT